MKQNQRVYPCLHQEVELAIRQLKTPLGLSSAGLTRRYAFFIFAARSQKRS